MLVSEAFAVASAFCIALSSMLISKLKGRVPLIQLTRWQWLAAFAMTGVVSVALGAWRSVGLSQFGLLAASSVFSSMSQASPGLTFGRTSERLKDRY